jgi:hypothetical protein
VKRIILIWIGVVIFLLLSYGLWQSLNLSLENSSKVDSSSRNAVAIETIKNSKKPAEVPATRSSISNIAGMLNNGLIKRMDIGFALAEGGLSEEFCERFQITDYEQEQISKILDQTVLEMKKLESKSVSKVKDADGGEFIKISKYWDAGGSAEYERLKLAISEVLQDERSIILLAGLGNSSLQLGDFGFYEKHLYISDEGVSLDGQSVPMLSIRPVDPRTEIANELQRAQNSVEFNDLKLKLDSVSKEINNGPFALFGVSFRASHTGKIERYRHVFEE